MAGSISVYISRQRNPKLFRWCDLAISEGYEKWQISAYFRNRMEDMLDASMKEEKIASVDMGTVNPESREGGVTRGPGIQLYLLPEDGEGCPCVRAYLDYMKERDAHVSLELCHLIEGDIKSCRDPSEEYIVGYSELEHQRLGGFPAWMQKNAKTLTRDRSSVKIDVDREPERKRPAVRKDTGKEESMEELKEDDLFGFF